MSEISELTKRLNANPIYALSLGSRELCHSNFLYWMFENYPKMIAVVFDGPVPDVEDIFREKLNFDLLIEFKSADSLQAIVMEIKVKDAPKLEQLLKYDEKIPGKYTGKVSKVLLSLVDVPDSIKSEGTWDCLSFDELGKKIIELLPASNVSKDHEIIIRFYAELCRDLDALVATAKEADRLSRVYFFSSKEKEKQSEIDQALEVLSFADTLNKQRASALHEEIERQAKSSGLVVIAKNSGLVTKSGFGLDDKTGHAGASLVLELPNPEKSKLSLGVHIQGLQYRRVLDFDGFPVRSRKQGKDDKGMQEFIAQTDGWKWMFGASHNNKKFDELNAQDGFFKGKADILTSQNSSKLLCSYAPRHIYQHTTVGDMQGVPINQVVEAVIADLHYAAQLLSDPVYVDRFVAWLPKS